MQHPIVDRAPVAALDTPSARLIRQAGSGHRACQRVQAAAYAAVAEAERLISGRDLAMLGVYGQGCLLAEARDGHWEEIPAATRATAALLCRAEVIGQGGPMGLGGEERGTRRYPWASGLGKGRARAGDGPAWTAAIEQAAGLLWPGQICLAPSPEEAEEGEPGLWTPTVLLVLDARHGRDTEDLTPWDLTLRGEILGLLLPLVGRMVLQQVPDLGSVPGLDRETVGVRSIRDGSYWPVIYDLMVRDALLRASVEEQAQETGEQESA
jgi:hypothetical protein